MLGWDDYTITLGIVIGIIGWGFFVVSTVHGVGRHNYYVSPSDQIMAQHWLFASEAPWPIAVMFVKISIACMLLRIKRSRPWLAFLYIMIAIQVATCIGSVTFVLFRCIPMRAHWDPSVTDARCVSTKSIYYTIYITAVISIVTDLSLAFLPLAFIRKMQRPLRDKIVLSALMGLGIFATIMSIVKTTVVKHYDATGDILWDSIDLSLWSILEEQAGIIAACIPCLRSPFERILDRIRFAPGGERGQDASSVTYIGDRRSYQISSPKRLSKNASGVADADALSEESVLPFENDGVNRQSATGRILKTTELHVSEEVSRVGSAGGGESWRTDCEKGFV